MIPFGLEQEQREEERREERSYIKPGPGTHQNSEPTTIVPPAELWRCASGNVLPLRSTVVAHVLRTANSNLSSIPVSVSMLLSSD